MAKPEPDPITIARLDGTARRHVATHTPHDVAVAELTAIATHGHRLRVDLLTEAAANLHGAHAHNPVTYWSGHDAARLLIAAGADPDQVTEQAAAVTARLQQSARHTGIGNP